MEKLFFGRCARPRHFLPYGALLTALALGALTACDEDEAGGGSASSEDQTPPAGGESGGAGGAGGASGMGGAAGMGAGGAGGGSCVPDEQGWEEARAALEARCGLCHGETPAFGAPQTLLDREALILGEPGERLIDRALARISAGDMPPAGQPTMSAYELEQLTSWAGCGALPPLQPPAGLEVDRPRFEHAGPPEASWEQLELRAAAEVEPVEDSYRCFSFSGPGAGEERYLRRIEPLIDDTRVVHHIVLYEVDGGAGDGSEQQCGAGLESSIYAWAPGAGALQFPEGGLVTNNARRYVLEVHYNNRAAYEDLTDRSGVRLFHSLPEGPAIDMLVLGPDGFNLPPRARTEVGSRCTIEEPLEVVAMLPHMHEIGVALRSEITRADGSQESMIDLRGWDFDFQIAYDAEGLQLSPGDQVETYCLFENMSDEQRRHGPNTDDEMCYHFLYVSPPPRSRRCDEPLEGPGYVPGECAPEEITSWAGSAEGRFNEGEPPSPPPAAEQAVPAGRWSLELIELYFESLNLGVAVADPELSLTGATGGIELTEEGRLSFDMRGESVLVTELGAMFNRQLELTFAGQLNAEGPEGVLSLSVDCPSAREQQISYVLDEEGKLWLFFAFDEPVSGIQVLRFQRSPEP